MLAGGDLISTDVQSRGSERGRGRLSLLLWFAFFGVLVFLAFKLVPPYMNNYQFEDKVREEAHFAGVNRKDPDTIRDDIFKQMHMLEIPAHREDIHIENTDAGLHISLDYTVVVDVPGYQFHLHFHPQGDSNSL